MTHVATLFYRTSTCKSAENLLVTVFINVIIITKKDEIVDVGFFLDSTDNK